MAVTPNNIPAEFHPFVSPSAISYQRTGRMLSLAHLGWSFLGIWLLLQFGGARKLRVLVEDIFERRSGKKRDRLPSDPPTLLPLAIYLVFLSLFAWLWSLPFEFAGQTLERRYGFGTQTVSGLLQDDLIAQAFGLIAIPLVWVAYRIHARFPRTWWLWIWGGTAPLLYFIVVLQPVVFSPMFNTYTAMPGSAVKDHILGIAERAGVSNATVLIENTSTRTRHVNAYVTGLGPSARIVINDTALRELPEDQLIAMISHELGHYVEHHILVGYITSVLGLGIFLWICSFSLPFLAERSSKWGVRGINDLALLPAIMLFVSLFLFMQSPIENAISRTLEHRADAYGLRLSHLNVATARLMVGFAERDFTDPNPPALLHFWFGTHPTLNERIAFALSYRNN